VGSLQLSASDFIKRMPLAKTANGILFSITTANQKENCPLQTANCPLKNCH
jgi:hypothetical protein